jgi:putative lipoprotein
MAKQFLPIACAIATVFLSTCPGLAQRGLSTGVITGTVSYRQRIALQPDAVIEVSLVDVSQADGPATRIAREKIPSAGRQIPIPFRLEYRIAEIQPSHSYQLRARITINGELLFSSSRDYPVFDNPGSPANIELIVDQVQAKPNARPAHVLLEETYWRLIELNGQLLARPPNSQEAHIVLHSVGETFTGGGGCNRLLGTYVRNGDALRFKMISSTMMACPGPVMKEEQNLNRALSSTVRFRIAGSTLELLDDRQTLAKFEARPAK